MTKATNWYTTIQKQVKIANFTHVLITFTPLGAAQSERDFKKDIKKSPEWKNSTHPPSVKPTPNSLNLPSLVSPNSPAEIS